MIQKKRFEAVVSDSLPGSSVGADGDEEGTLETPASESNDENSSGGFR